MKSILYVGATLMIGASIYGFVDYKQTSQKKEFTDMYAEEKITEPVVVVDVAAADVTEKKSEPAKKNAATKKTKPAVTKKAMVQKEEALPVIKPVTADEKLQPETARIDQPSENVIAVKEVNVEKKVKKRKLNTKLFSRGALDERYIEPKEKVEKRGAKKD